MSKEVLDEPVLTSGLAVIVLSRASVICTNLVVLFVTFKETLLLFNVEKYNIIKSGLTYALVRNGMKLIVTCWSERLTSN